MCIKDLDNDSTVNDPISVSDEDNLSIVGNPSNVEEAEVVVEKSSVVEDENFDFYEPSDVEEVVHYFDDRDNDMMRVRSTAGLSKIARDFHPKQVLPWA